MQIHYLNFSSFQGTKGTFGCRTRLSQETVFRRRYNRVKEKAQSVTGGGEFAKLFIYFWDSHFHPTPEGSGQVTTYKNTNNQLKQQFKSPVTRIFKNPNSKTR